MNYEDIYNDFPLRCAEVWYKMRSHPAIKDRNVTFMLMTAAAGIVMPHQHLKIQPGQYLDNADHPSYIGSKMKDYRKVLEIVFDALDASIENSPLFENIAIDKWSFFIVKEIKEIKDLAEFTAWNGLDHKEIKARKIVNILRNALAHNNICARKDVSTEEISHLTFFSNIKKNVPIEECKDADREKCRNIKKEIIVGHDVITMPADDLGYFLDAWFALLQNAKPKKSKHAAEMLRYAFSASLKPKHNEDAA